MRVGVLTGGGDVPGLNAAIRAVVKRGEGSHGHSIVGFRNGWKGVVDGDVRPLTRQDIRNVLPTGGTGPRFNDLRQLRYNDFSDIESRIDAAERATRRYLVEQGLTR